ncbi:MAG: hypothetical protein ACRBBP_09800 [Bdellovibrionales bacterium]
MRFLAVGSILLLFSSSALADYTCAATCIEARGTSYGAGASRTLFLGYKNPEPVTRRTKRQAWRGLRAQCDPFLLVTRYEARFEFGVGNILVSHTEAKRENACSRTQVTPRSTSSSSEGSSALQ